MFHSCVLISYTFGYKFRKKTNQTFKFVCEFCECVLGHAFMPYLCISRRGIVKDRILFTPFIQPQAGNSNIDNRIKIDCVQQLNTTWSFDHEASDMSPPTCFPDPCSFNHLQLSSLSTLQSDCFEHHTPPSPLMPAEYNVCMCRLYPFSQSSQIQPCANLCVNPCALVECVHITNPEPRSGTLCPCVQIFPIWSQRR